MTPLCRFVSGLLVAIGSLAGIACGLPRPETIPVRTIEPQMIEPAAAATRPADAIPIRLLDTQRRGNVGRVLLHMHADGELVEDPAWRWGSAPDRYLDTALRLELASSSTLRLVDASSAQTLAVTLLAWHLESKEGTRLVSAVELDFTRTDRAVQSQVIRGSEAVSAPLPGDLAAAAGRLLRRLASEIAAQIPAPGTRQSNPPPG